MSAHVLLNILNKFGKKIRCETSPSIVSVFPNMFNTFNNTGARMQDSVYHMTLILAIFASKRQDYAVKKRDVAVNVIA